MCRICTQGCDLWDFSLVDPDNRSPVDFAHRDALLEQATSFAAAAAVWRTGRVKQDLIRRILSFRQHYPGLFASGSYTPVDIAGADQAHAIAFLRQHDGMSLLVLAPRLPLGLGWGRTRWRWTTRRISRSGFRHCPVRGTACWGCTALRGPALHAGACPWPALCMMPAFPERPAPRRRDPNDAACPCLPAWPCAAHRTTAPAAARTMVG
ncbi:hypothetical protein RAA17_12625 [Komagataeibacter rhaeticus]|nr:hypothetical protein [Komagataeibacter rhaeticus]